MIYVFIKKIDCYLAGTGRMAKQGRVRLQRVLCSKTGWNRAGRDEIRQTRIGSGVNRQKEGKEKQDGIEQDWIGLGRACTRRTLQDGTEEALCDVMKFRT